MMEEQWIIDRGKLRELMTILNRVQNLEILGHQRV